MADHPLDGFHVGACRHGEACGSVPQLVRGEPLQANCGKSTLEAGRQAVIDRAKALGATADEAENLADKIYAIPSEKAFRMIADTSAAQATIDRFIYANNGRRINLFVDDQVGRQVAGSSMIARAAGGILPGPPSTRDNMLIHAATGEFVVKAMQVAIPENRRALEYMNNGGVIRRYAGGGYVAPVQYVPAGLSWTVRGSAPAPAPAQVNVRVVSNGIDLSRYLDVYVDGKLQKKEMRDYGAVSRG